MVELLQVLCDDSALYVTKLVEIGNGRDSALKQAKSKYFEKESNLQKEQIVGKASTWLKVRQQMTSGTVRYEEWLLYLPSWWQLFPM